MSKTNRDNLERRFSGDDDVLDYFETEDVVVANLLVPPYPCLPSIAANKTEAAIPSLRSMVPVVSIEKSR